MEGNSMNEQLNQFREYLDKIDRSILESLAKRISVVKDIGKAKFSDHDLKFRDFTREEEIIKRIVEKGKDFELDPIHVRKLFGEIIEYSLRVQEQNLFESDAEEKAPLVAYHGCRGSYSYLAAKTHFGVFKGESFLRSYETLPSMIQALVDGERDYALLPLENTTAGSINESYDLLGKYDLKIIGEEILSIQHCLMTLDKIPLHRIKRVLSHPQALLQCSRFLDSLDCQKEAFSNTAKAAEYIQTEQDPSLAAIASRDAAKSHGLHILKDDITNQKKNFTRMIIVSREERFYDPRIVCKTSLIFSLGHQRGALLKALSIFDKYQLNLTKLESRPKINSPWEYVFYVDFEGNNQDEVIQEALSRLSRETSSLKNLGSYPSHLERKVKGL
jgi:chorismate mutase/prephenate dehydratase